MGKGFVIYKEMCEYSVTYEENHDFVPDPFKIFQFFNSVKWPTETEPGACLEKVVTIELRRTPVIILSLPPPQKKYICFRNLGIQASSFAASIKYLNISVHPAVDKNIMDII